MQVDKTVNIVIDLEDGLAELKVNVTEVPNMTLNFNGKKVTMSGNEWNLMIELALLGARVKPRVAVPALK